MDTTKSFSSAELESISTADDLKIAPFRADGVTYGTPTWIWNVVVDGELYVRAYNGKDSRWYQSAVVQKAGQIHAAGMVKNVLFVTINDVHLNDAIDEAYKEKYNGSPYMLHMIGEKAKAATVHIIQK